MRILTTFSGRMGDILWSLPTAKLISRIHGEAVDFAIMPQYFKLIPLLAKQPFIAGTYTIQDWVCTGSPYGDQPWKPPDGAILEGYDKIYHLTYQKGPTAPLSQFIAQQQGLTLDDSLFPVLEVSEIEKSLPFIAVGFGAGAAAEKKDFLERFRLWLAEAYGNRFELIYVDTLPWVQAVRAIHDSVFFLGCKSALAVAAALLEKRGLIFEPEEWRRHPVFSDPRGSQVMPGTWDFTAFVRTADAWLGEEYGTT